MSRQIDVTILELVNGEARHIWMGLQECAWHHHLHPLKLKELIITGYPLNPYAKEEITFDIASESPNDIIVDDKGNYIIVPAREHPTGKED